MHGKSGQANNPKGMPLNFFEKATSSVFHDEAGNAIVPFAPWQVARAGAFHAEPSLKLSGLTQLEVDAFKAKHASEEERVQSITGFRVEGYTGDGADPGKMMGVYRINAEHSPKNGAQVYTKQDISSDEGLHIFRGATGFWWFSDTGDMTAGKSTGWLKGNRVMSPLKTSCQWTKGGDPISEITVIESARGGAASKSAGPPPPPSGHTAGPPPPP